MGSESSFCHSSSWRSQPNWSASLARTPGLPFPSRGVSLYFQCAATPCSATRCMSSVRIWISMRSACGPTTVVWSDW